MRARAKRFFTREERSKPIAAWDRLAQCRKAVAIDTGRTRPLLANLSRKESRAESPTRAPYLPWCSSLLADFVPEWDTAGPIRFPIFKARHDSSRLRKLHFGKATSTTCLLPRKHRTT